MTHHTDAERAEIAANVSAAPVLRAMASNYEAGHVWDALDAKTCIHAASEIDRLRIELQAARRATAAPVPQGWKLVPVEPPQEALYAIGRLVDDPRAFEDSESFWDYLLAAAPQPPEAALVPSIAVTPEMVEAANEAYCPFGDMELALCAALQVAPIPPGAAPVQLPENIREGEPYDNPAFEALARALGVWGTAQSAVCAQFWIAAKEQST